MMTEEQTSSLKQGDILFIENHFKHEYLKGREFIFSKISSSAGYVLGNLIIHENNSICPGEEATFRLSDNCIKAQTWSDFCLRSRLEDVLESLHRQIEVADSEMNGLTQDEA